MGNDLNKSGKLNPYAANDLKLDSNYFKRIPEELMTAGTRDTLTFMKDPSPENAFFIIPEDPDNQKNVLFAHASVNLMKQYLREVTMKTFGLSLERVYKVNDVFQQILNFLSMKEEDELTELTQKEFDAPFNLEENDLAGQRVTQVRLR